MAFNTVASLLPDANQKLVYFTVALPLLAGVAFYAVLQVFREGRLIRNRLADYVMAGWLPDSYPYLFSKTFRRLWMLAMSPWWGNVIATYKLQREVTELAYLRDQITRGVVDAAGLWRERELLYAIRDHKAAGGIDDPRGLRPYWPRKKPVYGAEWLPPSYPGPAGLVGQLPAPPPAGVPAPLGSAPTYSAVDPTWGPPRS
jgi:hypothetical protein